MMYIVPYLLNIVLLIFSFLNMLNSAGLLNTNWPAIQYKVYSDQIGYSCCGKLFIGAQNGVFYLTIFLICGTMGLFFAFE